MAIYEYQARCIGITSAGDLELELDLGFNIQTTQIVKLDINIQHPRDAHGRLHGLLIKDVNEHWGEFPLLVHTVRKDEKGRYLASVLTFVDFSNINPNNPQRWVSVNSILLEEGIAIPSE